MNAEKRLLEVTNIAIMLANRLVDSSAGEEQPEYDRSRTWCDRQDDYAEAKRCLRELRPTERAVKRRLQKQP